MNSKRTAKWIGSVLGVVLIMVLVGTRLTRYVDSTHPDLNHPPGAKAIHGLRGPNYRRGEHGHPQPWVILVVDHVISIATQLAA